MNKFLDILNENEVDRYNPVDLDDLEFENLTDEEIQDEQITASDIHELIDTIQDKDLLDIIGTAILDAIDNANRYALFGDEEMRNPNGELDFYSINGNEFDNFDDEVYDDGDRVILTEGISVTLNKSHIKQLKKARRTSAWKKEAKKRAKFRKSAQGKMMKRKQKIYQKKYRAQHKSQLKRYQKNRAKFK